MRATPVWKVATALLMAGALELCASSAVAQSYPLKPIRLIAPFPPGGAVDLVARTLGDRLRKAWGQPVVVENRAGAGGGIGIDAAAKAPADGYTLALGTNGPLAINKALFGKLSYDPEKDLAPISLLVTGAQLLVVHPSVPASSLAEFIALLRKNPGRLSYGSVGPGSAAHLTMEMLKARAGVFMVHIPYRGNPPLMIDLISGQIQAAFAVLPIALPQVKAARLKGLAVTSAARSPLAPDIPTVAEAGIPGFEATGWIGLLAPAGTSLAVIEKVAAETKRIMRLPDVAATFATQGFDAVGSSPGEFASFIRTEEAKWSEVVTIAGAKPE